MSGLIGLVLRNKASRGRRPSSPSPFSAEELEYLQSIYQHLPSELDLDGQQQPEENDEQGSIPSTPTKPVTFEGILPSDSWNALEVVAAQFTAFSYQGIMSVFVLWFLAFAGAFLFVSTQQNV